MNVSRGNEFISPVSDFISLPSYHHVQPLPYNTMSRAFCIPGIFFLVCALVLSFLTSISLPFLPGLDIVRVHFAQGALQDGSTQGISELRVRLLFHPSITEFLILFLF
jgi:hypothetical protein